MLALLRELKGVLTILLVEHDMETVFSLADRITVLVEGRVIASGVPAKIRANSSLGSPTSWTSSPTATILKSCSTSRFRIRMQPWDTLFPIEEGTLVP